MRLGELIINEAGCRWASMGYLMTILPENGPNLNDPNGPKLDKNPIYSVTLHSHHVCLTLNICNIVMQYSNASLIFPFVRFFVFDVLSMFALCAPLFKAETKDKKKKNLPRGAELHTQRLEQQWQAHRRLRGNAH